MRRTTISDMGVLHRMRTRLADALQGAAGADGAYAGGRRLRQLKRYREAAEAFEQAETQYRERLGRTHSRVVDTMAQRAWCLVAMGLPKEAAELYRSAIEAKLINGDASKPTVGELRDLLADADRRSAAGDLGVNT